MKTRVLIKVIMVIIFYLIVNSVKTQTLPDEMYLSPDGRMLFTGGQPSTGYYDSTVIRDIYLTFPQSNYWTLLTNNYSSGTLLPATMIVDGKTYDSVGVRFRGQTSYQNVKTQKKSFKIKVDYVHDKQDIMGYNSLKLNNSYDDKSFMREVFYLHQICKHIPAAKANYIHLYINNVDWGLYPNIQQLNKDFLEEWFLSNNGANWRADAPTNTGQPGQWGDGTAGLNYLSADTTVYQKYYTLKSSDIVNSWSHLVNTCDALNDVTSINLTDLPNYLDIDRALWFLASEIVFTDDDSYVMKGKMDYYVYYEPETGRMTPIEYDGNSSLVANDATSSNWGPFKNVTKVNYPLLYKILTIPQWRQRYLAHLRTIINEELNTTAVSILNNYYNIIDASVNADPKKLYTYTQFQSEKTVLVNFINNRRNYLLSNSEVAEVAPIITNVAYYNSSGQIWISPKDNEVANITAQVASTNGISQVNLFYDNDLVGNFTSTLMYDDGLHNDNASSDGIYGGTIPVQTIGSWVRFYIEATANNTAKSVSYYPSGAEHNVMVYIVQPQVANNDTLVVINEIMTSNSSTVTDNNGEYDDWIELYNKSTQAIDISGYFLTDNPTNIDKWEIPYGTVIPANGYLIFWADEDSSQGANHCNFKLSASGESLMLLNANQQLVDSVSWSIQTADMGFARVPNGIGSFVIQLPTFGINNNFSSVMDEETKPMTEFSVYPNPSNGIFNISFTSLTNVIDLSITNLQGKVVYNDELNIITGTYSEQINISNYPKGIYFIKLTNNHHVEVKKIVVL